MAPSQHVLVEESIVTGDPCHRTINRPNSAAEDGTTPVLLLPLVALISVGPTERPHVDRVLHTTSEHSRSRLGLLPPLLLRIPRKGVERLPPEPRALREELTAAADVAVIPKAPPLVAAATAAEPRLAPAVVVVVVVVMVKLMRMRGMMSAESTTVYASSPVPSSEPDDVVLRADTPFVPS